MVKRLRNFLAAVTLGLLLSTAVVKADNIKTMTTTANLNVRSGAGTNYKVLGSYNKNAILKVLSIEKGWAKISYNGKTAYCSAAYLKDITTLTTPSGSPSNKTMKTTANLNVRSGAGTSYKAIGSLSKGSTISVISTSNGWAKISYKGQTGYCSTNYLQEISNVPTTPTAPVGNLTAMKTTATLNIRSGAGTNFKIVGSYPKGASVSVISISNGWAKVSFNGKTAYCSAKYLQATVAAEKPSESPKPVETVKPSESYTTMEATTYVNVRKGPGTSYGKLGMLAPKEKVKAISISGGWAKISYKSQEGYVSASYLKEIISKPEETISYKVMKSTTWLNVRRGASVASDKLGLLSLDEQVKVISISNGWAKILYKNQIAYCSASYLQEVKTSPENTVKPSEPESPKTPETPVAPEVPKEPQVPETPETPPAPETPAVPEVPETPPVSETPPAPEAPIESETPKAPIIKEVSDTISVNTAKLNVRKGPGQEHEAIGTVSQGQLLKRTGIHESGWSRIEYNGKEAYVSGSYIVLVTADSNNNTMYHYSKDLSFTLDNFISGQLTKPNVTLKGETINAETLNKYLNPEKISNDGKLYQFLNLNKFRDNVNAEKLNVYLNSLTYDTFHGQGQAFIDAAREYNIDTLYLVAHTILETGYGKSTLARGVDYVVEVPVISEETGEQTIEKTTVRVHNLFGIGAYDSNPLGGGASTAYKNGWTSIELAIKGGAKWIAQGYIHRTDPLYHQYTLYMMRWNTNSYKSPSSNYIWHQYATDIAWADSISLLMNKLSFIYENAVLDLEIPKFLQQLFFE